MRSRSSLVVLALFLAPLLTTSAFADSAPNPNNLPPCGPNNKKGDPCQAQPAGQPGQAGQAGGTQNNSSNSGKGPNQGSGYVSPIYPIERNSNYFASLTMQNGQNPGQSYSVAFDNTSVMPELSFIAVSKKLPNGGIGNQHICTSLNEDSTCRPDQWDGALIQSTIGRCAEETNGGCVSDLTIITKDGKSIKATPLSKFPANLKGFNGFKANDGSGYPPGHVPWIFRAEGDGPGSEHDYLVNGFINTGGSNQNGNWKFNTTGFKVEVVPIVRENVSIIKATSVNEYSESSRVVVGPTIEPACLLADDGVCLHRRAFPEGIRIKLVLQLPRNISGWLNGSLSKPIASVTKKSDSYDEVTVEAAPGQTVMGGGIVPKSTITANDWDWRNSLGQDSGPKTFSAQMIAGQNSLFIANSGEVGALEWYSAWSKYFGDKAIRVTDAWSIMSTQKKNNNGCGNGSLGLQGIVSTNAAVYDPGAPTADTTSRTLNYRVASPINDPSGKPIPGQYAISMSETIAQCLYNVKSIPSQAQLIITDKNGTQVVQTAAIKTQDGWINFAANNFDFSDLSLLQVKLGADATAKPASTTTSTTATAPTPTKPTTKVTTITCVKGKLKKSVSGVNPTCPSGYKKS